MHKYNIENDRKYILFMDRRHSRTYPVAVGCSVYRQAMSVLNLVTQATDTFSFD